MIHFAVGVQPQVKKKRGVCPGSRRSSVSVVSLRPRLARRSMVRVEIQNRRSRRRFRSGLRNPRGARDDIRLAYMRPVQRPCCEGRDGAKRPNADHHNRRLLSWRDPDGCHSRGRVRICQNRFRWRSLSTCEGTAPMIRLLVCGNRDWTCADTICAWLRPFHDRWVRTGQRSDDAPTLIHGAAKGADLIAGIAAFQLGWHVRACPAEWDKLGKAAGIMRNQQMLDEERPTRALAFGRILSTSRGERLSGTGDMVARLNSAGILVTVVPAPGVLPA
jgi:hypothetical protein